MTLLSLLAQSIGQQLDLLHQHGIVHRSIVPESILVSVAGRTILAGFEFALFPGCQDLPPLPVETLRYASPEERAWKPLDRRSDIYALAKVLRETTTSILSQQEESTPPNARFEAALLRALSSSPQDRPSSMQAFFAELFG